MEEIGNLAHGFGVALTLPNIGFMFIGITLGVLIGVLPGLGGANGIAILLPLTFSMNPTSAIIMLSCIYWGALFGGAITSILFNIPGEPWSVATTFDGYPMAQQGKAAQALTAAFTSSFVGALFAVLLITFLAPLLAKFALKFGPAEFFAVQLLTFASFVGMSKEPPAKTLAAMMLGFALAAVGMDTVTGTLRMTYGVPALLKGFDFLIAVIGLFGIGEILLTMEEGLAFKGKSARISSRAVWNTWGEILKYWKTFLRSTAVGCWMGITPGGATPASFMSYGMARRMSKHPERFGKGDIQGVIAPETAAHAAGTSALLPMLTLVLVVIAHMMRMTRAAILNVMQSAYIETAELKGLSPMQVIWRHALPNAVAPMIVQLSFLFAYAVLSEATLSFLGVGAVPPTPTWGNIMSEGRDFMREAPWIITIPGVALMITVMGLNLLGDGLRDVLDPRLRIQQ